MKDIRIGNDIEFRWRVTIDGQIMPLALEKLTLRLGNAIQGYNEVDYDIEDTNVIVMRWLGIDQKVTGKYTLTLYRNRGEEQQSVIDEVNAVRLVSSTAKIVNGESDCDNLELKVVEMAGNLSIAGGGGGVQTINGEHPDENGNINVAVMTPAQEEGLERALQLEGRVSDVEREVAEIESAGFITDTPEGDKEYVRKHGEWVETESIAPTIVSEEYDEEGNTICTWSDGHVTTIKRGQKGAQGERGAQGEKGEQGEAGAQGEQGRPGIPGRDGDNGADGADGFTPYIGENGNWWINGQDTGFPSRGQRGETGATGADGKSGADGHTPVKGVDYFTEEDQQDMAEAAAGMLQPSISELSNAVAGKVAKPAQKGENGQVLTTDGEGGTSWADVQGGGDDYTKLENKPSINGTTLIGNINLATMTPEQQELLTQALAVIGKRGVVSQKQTWASDYSGYTMSNQKYGLIPQANIDLFHSAGAEFNNSDAPIAKTAPWGETVQHLPGYFYLNGLGDISYEEMIVIFNNKNRIPTTNTSLTKGRTNFFWEGINSAFTATSINGYALSFSTLEVIAWNVNRNPEIVNSLGNGFFNDTHLMVITPALQLNGDLDLRSAFQSCHALKHIKLMGLYSTRTINFGSCRNLSNESIRYMVANSSEKGAITITLHADAYARAIADAEIQAALESKPMVSLVSA